MKRSEKLNLFCLTIDSQIVDCVKVQFGEKYQISRDSEIVYITLFESGKSLVQGKKSELLTLIKCWAGVYQLPDDKGYPGPGYVDLPQGWREWNENARFINDYISANGLPDEENVPDNYKINREILFHDYMFRNSIASISYEKISFVIRNWFRRYCFIPIDIDDLISQVQLNCKKYINSNASETDFSIVALSVSYIMCSLCSKHFININGQHVCPQSGTDQNTCVYELVDAMYPYTETKKVIAYTKSNLQSLINRKLDKITWHSLDIQTPIEEKMEKGLESTGLLFIPQYQAYDSEHKYRIDFTIKTSNGPRIAIECDGLQFHAHPTTYKRDRIRDRYLQSNGFYVMRFSSNEIFNNLDKCLLEIDEMFWKIQRGIITMKNEPRTNYFGVGE